MTDALVLRGYQTDCIAALRASFRAGRKAPLHVLPTAAGKTVVLAVITLGACDKGNHVLVVVHRREFLKQASAKLIWAGVPHGIIAAGFKPDPDQPVQVGSIQTIIRRLDRIGSFDLIIFDEAHHCQAETWRELIAAQPTARLLGVTATPCRADGKGLGTEDGGCFDDLIVGPSIADLVKEGFLSPSRCFVPEHRLDMRGVRTQAGDYVASDVAAVVDTAAITGDAVDQYTKRAAHQPAVAFCTTVAHAEHAAAQFRSAGYRSVCVHGGTPAMERDAAIAGLGNGAIEVLTACDLISEGLDVPAVGCINDMADLFCAGCGEPRPAGVRKPPRHVAGELAELTAERFAAMRRMSFHEMASKTRTEAELQEFASARGYHRGWVWHRLQEQEQPGMKP